MKGPLDYGVRAVERAVRLLAALAEADRPPTLTVVAGQADLSVPTTFRLLRTLQDQGLVSYDELQGTYALGPRVLELSRGLLRQLDVVQVARQHLVAVRNETGETATLAVRSGDVTVNVAVVESLETLRRVKTIGEASPLYAGTNGKIFLAASSDQEIAAYLERVELVPFTDYTPTDPRVIRQQVEQTRAVGFAESTNELGSHGTGFAAAIRAHDGRVVAALNVAGPARRCTPEARERWI